MTDTDNTQRKTAGTPKNEQALLLSRSIVNRINRDAGLLTEQWHNPKGTKTRHFILDDFLPGGLADSVRLANARLQ